MASMLRYSILALSMLLVLTACNEEEDTSTNESGGGDASATETGDWPNEQITLVVPYSTGGSADRQARELANLLGDELGVSVMVENREGGGGAVGTTTHYQGDPSDGTHIIYQSHPHFEASIVREADFGFDDFDYMGITHSSPITIWVDEDSEFETLEDLLNAIDENPGSYSYAMISASWSDIAIKMVMDELGMDVRAVPYDGGGPMRTALMGGEVDFIASDIEGTLAGAGDDLRPLAIFSDEPYEHSPDVPLINDEMERIGYETSFPTVSNMRFIQVKSEFKENYPERYEILEEAIANVAQGDEFIQWGENQSMYLTWIPEDEAQDTLSQTIEVIYQYEDLFQ